MLTGILLRSVVEPSPGFSFCTASSSQKTGEFRRGKGDVTFFGKRVAFCYSSEMKISDILTILRTDGWFIVATRGSHRQFKHPVKSGRVTVAGKPSDDLAPGTLNSILKQAELKE